MYYFILLSLEGIRYFTRISKFNGVALGYEHSSSLEPLPSHVTHFRSLESGICSDVSWRSAEIVTSVMWRKQSLECGADTRIRIVDDDQFPQSHLHWLVQVVSRLGSTLIHAPLVRYDGWSARFGI
jgi:hypothetical protein